MNNISDCMRIESDVTPCEQCGSASKIGRGLCLNCLLHRCLDANSGNAENLYEALNEVDVRDADWRIGNYQILEEIGRGGMGVIYRARQRHSRRIVALKRILSYQADSQETLIRFRREAEAAASLDHPNILPIYEVSESEEGLPFFSMKFATSGSLLDLAPALRNESLRSVALMAKVARAVQYAHFQGILHRDLKPGNVLLDGRGEPLVSDFGLAKWLDISSDLTRTLTIFGTPGYIAPEQAQRSAANLTPAADIYSLGAILFDLFTGRPPFLGEHALAVIQQASEKPAPKLRSLLPGFDRDLEIICSKCLEREPRARYRFADDLAEDLERWLEGRPIIARPVSPPVRIWRWSKRNPKLAGSLAAAFVLGMVGVIAVFTNSRLSSIVQNAELARHSVVVTPFEDLDELSTSSNSAKAATSALTTALMQTNGIRASSSKTQVVDPWSTEDWKKIGESATARMVISGTVRRREGKQRVAIHVIDTASGKVVSRWLGDPESAGEIGKVLVKQISEALDRPPANEVDSDLVGGTSDPSARSYYERGKEFFFRHNFADLDRAIDSLRTAVRLDTNYAYAYALLATACQLKSLLNADGPWLKEADGAIAKALSIAPMLAEGYDARAGNSLYRGRARESLDDFLTAYELEPGNSRACARLAHGYHVLGRADWSMFWYAKATRRETQPFYADNIGDIWTDLGEYNKAEEAYNTAAIFQPDLPVSAIGLSRIELFRGEFDKARARCEQAREKYRSNPQLLMIAAQIEFFSRNFGRAEQLYAELMKGDHAGGVDYHGSVRFLSATGFIHAMIVTADGKALLNEARTLDQKELTTAPDNPARLYSLAANYAALDDEISSLNALESAIAAGWIDYRSMTLDPRFDAVRATSRFEQAVANLQQATRQMADRTGK
ncbi:MAG TPA: FlgO family outer membrane protein [Candidatus Udaeobacter sp.]